MNFEIIVAIDSESGIGKNNDLPWHLPADLKHFKEITSSTTDPTKQNAVIMGRKTWDSIPEKFRPLPNRKNIVLTTQSSLNTPEGVSIAHTLEAALTQNPDIETYFIIGGGQLFKEALNHPSCTKLHLTRIHQSFDCDTHLAPIPPTLKCIEKTEPKTENDLSFHFETHEKTT